MNQSRLSSHNTKTEKTAHETVINLNGLLPTQSSVFEEDEDEDRYRLSRLSSGYSEKELITYLVKYVFGVITYIHSNF